MPDRVQDRLFEQLPWLRTLAHQLSRDPHVADDVVQDTVVAALRSGGWPASLRSWLGSIMRNALGQRRRADARRLERERRVAEARGHAAPSSLDVVSELSTYRLLLELVDALEEPYRTVITRRFLCGETPAEIARALQVPRKTVYTRIDRGLTRLRRQLDESVPGGRDAWRAAFALSRIPGGVRETAPLTGAGVTLMKTKLIFAALAVASLLILWSSMSGPGGSTSSPGGADEPFVIPETARREQPAERQVVRLAGSARTSPGPDAEMPHVQGLVVDLDGHPVADLEVVFESGQGPDLAPDPAVDPVHSDFRGRFELPVPEGRGRLRVADPSWATALHPWLKGTAPAEPVLVVVAPRRSYAGSVVDEDGLPIAGARIDLDLPDAWAQKLEALGDVVALPETLEFTYSDEQGAFRLSSVPFIGGSTLVARRDGYEPDQAQLPDSDHESLLFTLRSTERGLRGIVLDARDRPVRGALVSTGGRAVETRGDGSFTVAPPYRREGWIRALKTGVGTVSLSFKEHPQLLEGRADLVLKLSEDELSIRGVLLDEGGAPVPDAIVWTPDTTYFGEVLSLDLGKPITGMNTIEGLLSGTPTPSRTVMTTTGTDGSFELGGLTTRSYALFAMTERDLAVAGPVYAEPGTDGVRLVLSAGTPQPLSGRVLSKSGAPLVGVRIGIGRTVPWDRPVRPSDPWSSSPVVPPSATRTLASPIAVTDADGRFSLRSVHTDGAFLTFQGDAVFIGLPFPLDEAPDPGNLEVRLDARSTFRVLVADPSEADAFSLEGNDGRFQTLFMQVEQLTMSVPNLALVDGRSGIGSSREGEATIVLMRDGQEVRRVRAFLPAGGVHELQL